VTPLRLARLYAAVKLARMNLRIPTAPTIALVIAAILPLVAAPQAQAEDEKWIGPPSALPHGPRREPRNLDFLFEALKIAPDADSAKAIEGRIWSIWLASGSDTCNLLMTRAKAETDAEKLDRAIQLLDVVVELKPDFVEGWNRRATLFYMQKDYGHAMGDLREVLAREPRHFGALAGLGAILQDIGEDKAALDVYRKALAIDPHLEGMADKVKTLAEKLEGRAI
jgi:tetratricopeptide (TPR) repeat protein